MKAILVPCIVLMLAGCGSDDPPAKAQQRAAPRKSLFNPVTAPISIGDKLKDDLRTQNDAAKARRRQIDDMFESK